MVSRFRRIGIAGCIAGLLVVAVPRNVPARAAPATQGDPAVGPHARQDAEHASVPLALAPAHGSITPRAQVKAAPSAVAGPSTPSVAASNKLFREVFGFAPYWQLSRNASWNYSLLSTVAYFGLTANNDGTFNTSDSGWTGWNSQALTDTFNRAHAAGDRDVVVIKAFSNATINGIVSSSTARQTLINNTINAIAQRGLDGVNIDFEGSTSSSYPNLQADFTSFTGQLSSQVYQRWPNAMVSVDTYSGAASWDAGFFNISALAPKVDAFFIMGYDMASGNMPGHAGPNAPLTGWTYNDTTAVAQYLSKAPASKIILGVPYYGYKWSTTSNQPYASIVPGSGAIANTYSGVLDDLSCGAQQQARGWDGTAQSPWSSWWSPGVGDPCGGNYNSWRELYYDDAASLARKCDLDHGRGVLEQLAHRPRRRAAAGVNHDRGQRLHPGRLGRLARVRRRAGDPGRPDVAELGHRQADRPAERWNRGLRPGRLGRPARLRHRRQPDAAQDYECRLLAELEHRARHLADARQHRRQCLGRDPRRLGWLASIRVGGRGPQLGFLAKFGHRPRRQAVAGQHRRTAAGLDDGRLGRDACLRGRPHHLRLRLLAES